MHVRVQWYGLRANALIPLFVAQPCARARECAIKLFSLALTGFYDFREYECRPRAQRDFSNRARFSYGNFTTFVADYSLALLCVFTELIEISSRRRARARVIAENSSRRSRSYGRV